MKSKILIACCLTIVALPLVADDDIRFLRKGTKEYREGNFEKAFELFTSPEKEGKWFPQLTFNAMTSMARLEKINEMEKYLTEHFDDLGQDLTSRAKSSYNLGTKYLEIADEADKNEKLAERANELNKSIEWLQKSLLDSPGDHDAKINYEYAEKLLKKLEDQQQQQDKNNKQNQDQDKQQDQQQDQEQQQQKDNEDNKQQNNQQQDQQQDQQKQQQQRQQQQKEREVSDSVAKNLLEAAKNSEKEAMRKMRQKMNEKNRKRSKNRRDW